jgi:hypothetical protein
MKEVKLPVFAEVREMYTVIKLTYTKINLDMIT